MADVWRGGSRKARFAVTVLGLVALVSSVTWSAQGAVNLPGGSCFDGKYFDGLSSIGDAGQCSAAISKAGFGGTAWHNASAKTALIRLPIDGIFHFSGHSLSAFAAGGATGLLFESPGPNQKMDVLLGDPAGLIMQGPVTVCSVNGGCRSGNIVSYPWAQLLAKFNLVVLQSCQTGKTSLAHLSIAQHAHLAGAGNVIGFGANTTSPSAWAGSFFGNIGNGVPYATAVASAAGACCGYGSWVLLKNPGAPTSLYPRGYYVPPMRIGVPQVGSVTSFPLSADAPTASLERWLGHRVAGDIRWTADPAGESSVRQAYLPGRGLFQIDAASLEVTQAIFEPELSRRGTDRTLEQTAASDAARRFATSHYSDFSALTERSVEHVDHGIYDEYRFRWQLRRGQAWLPDSVTVGVNSATGRVATYFSERKPATISVTPRVSAKDAQRSAMQATRLTESLRPSHPVLEVRVVRGVERLVWVTEIETVSTGGMYIPDYEVIWTDAVTGKSERAPAS